MTGRLQERHSIPIPYKRQALSLALLLLAATLAVAQLTTGTIIGTVADQSGAAVPGATVAVKNVETGVSRSTVTGPTGRYEAPNLPVGSYEVSVTMAGFQTSIRAGIELTVGRTAVVDHVLQVGEITQAVTVTGEAALVETTTATVTNLVDEKKVEDLPLNNRDLTELTYLQPGVLRVPRTGGRNLFAGMGSQITVAGARGTQNLYLLDGVSNSDLSGNPQGASSSYTGAETVKEFQVITNNYSAEYVSAAGAIVSAVTKSGTNAFHGSLFEFLRNDNLDATRWEDNKNAAAGARSPEFIRNQFGGSLGGPLFRDRTFFFGSYEATREREGQVSTARVPDLEARAGRLPPEPRRDPAGNCLPLAPTPFDSAVISRYMALYPVPGQGNAIVPETGAPRCDGTVLISGPGRSKTTDNYFAAKMDHQFASQLAGFLSGTYNFNSGSRKPFGVLSEVTGSFDESKKHIVSVRHTSVLSPTMLNEFNFGFSWTRPHGEIPLVERDWSGLKYIPNRQEMGSLSVGDGVSTVGHAHSASTFQQAQLTFKDGVSLTRGSHSMRWGLEFQRFRYLTFGAQEGYNGEYTFTTLRDFLANRPDQLTTQIQLGPDPVRNIRQLYFGTYFQDNYQVRPSLTLNLGLRYEFTTLPNETEGKLSNLVNYYDPEVTLGKFYTQATLLSFSPRFGFAWAPGNRKTSLRGGYGIFYEHPRLYHYRTPLEEAPPFIQVATVNSADLRQQGTTLRFPDAFTQQYPLLQSTPQIWTMEHDMKNTYVHRWSLTLQREVGSSWVFSAGYTGSRGLHLWVQTEENVNKWQGWPDSSVKPKFWPGITGTNRINPAWGFRTRIHHPMGNSYYHGLALSAQKRMSFGLQLQAAYTFSKTIDDGAGIVGGDSLPENQRGNQFWDFYLWRALSSQDFRNNLVLNFTYEFPQAPYSGILGKIVNGWRMNGIWTASSGSPRSVSDGRTVQRDRIGVTTGNRADLIPGGDSNPTEGTTAGCVGVRNVSPIARAGTPLGGPDLYFDPCQFAPSQLGYYGNLGRNTVIGPGLLVFDWSLFKEVAVTEGSRVQFRAEFFNVLNRTNFSFPAMGPFLNNGNANTAVGQINSTRDQGRARQIQFGLKYNF